jgi:ATP-dependent DNA helicase RecG
MAADDLKEIVRALAGPLQAEARKGYRDTAVIGVSIAEYARRWAERALALVETEAGRKRCRKIRETLADYARSDAEQRKPRVEGALGLLAQLDGSRARRTAGGPFAFAQGRLRNGRPTEPAGMGMPALQQPLAAGRKSPPQWVKRLAKLGIETNRDLLYHFPRDYLPLRRIADLVDAERAAVVAEAVTREEAVAREGRGFRLMRYALEVADSSGRAWVTSFARGPRRGPRAMAIAGSPLSLNFAPGTRLLIEGLVRRAGRLIEIQYSGSERVEADLSMPALEPGRLVPLYPLTDGVYQGQVRPVVRRLLAELPDDLPDPLPAGLRQRHDLLPLTHALREIHLPSSAQSKEAATRRLAFEELLTLQVALAQRKRERQQPGSGLSMPPRGDVVAVMEEVLPFSLTRAQQRVISEVAADMACDLPMCRLLQGDVGSGKTVVAAAALMIALQNGYQGAIMAPTELLAEQHYLVLSRLLAPVGVRVELLTGSLRGQDREQSKSRISDGRAQVVVGTQALIQEGVEFHQLGLVIIDEQHRFGVRQRAELRTKGGRADTLVMTATPIPRTLALTLYGDLELSVLDEMPPGRQTIKTAWFPSARQKEAYEFVRREVSEGRQAYVVCPLIEESEKLQAEAATKLSEELAREVFPELRVGLLHGAMKVAEKDAAMEAFRAGEVDVLTTTTVIEVGVDVPNATVMLVLNAERFGLAQLHQLGGGVGGGAHESHCLLLSDRRHDPGGRITPQGDESLQAARRRLQVMLAESDGFKIAEEDLLLRGPGEFYGTRQHGLPDLRLARMAREMGVLEEAREAACWLVDQDPELAASEHAALREQVAALRARMDRAAG